MNKIIIIGLGPGNPKHLTEEAVGNLLGKHPIYLRTIGHPSARYLVNKGMKAHSFDQFYENEEKFEQVYKKIAFYLISAVNKHKTVCYAVPGHPEIGEATVSYLRRICPPLKIKLEIVPGISFIEPLLDSLEIDLLDGFTIIDALSIGKLNEPLKNNLIIAQVYNRTIASKVKLKLLDLYPDEQQVTIVRNAGMPSGQIWRLPLYALDRKPFFNHLTTIYLPPYASYITGNLIAVMKRLRADDGCPWDKQQTHKTLRQYVVEEAYEVVAAIEREDDESLKEELGDLLLQVIFHSQIAEEENRFDFYQVVSSIVAKLLRRHPHVFGNKQVEDSSQVKVLWEEIKADEKNTGSKSLMVVDQALPALLKAYKLQKRAADVGFDWPSFEGPLQKAREELNELEEACASENQYAIEEEVGDYLFTIVNISRFLKVNPEMALGKTINKFIDRFYYVLEQAEKHGRSIGEYSLDELDRWWEEAKKIRKMRK
ncbi:MAG: nucleoside triphosphate pyrophosphohydrolase [Bacillota bacterium]|nr:nucleoside triphosphate pyrophosphohydrolase [Bacillota bacterium]